MLRRAEPAFGLERFAFETFPGERKETSPASSGAPAHLSESTTTAFFPWKGKENIHVRSQSAQRAEARRSRQGANRRARQEELIPGVFYTAKGENLPVQMSVRSFAKLFSQVGRTTVFNLEIEGDGTHPVLIWATQRDPITSRFTHIDFYGVDLDKPVKITVPVEFTGVARGTKVGGKLETYREQIQLMAKPLDMPAKVTIDISGMDVGTTIQIADVKLPEGVKAAYDNNYAIVSVLMPGGDDAAAE